MEEIDKSSDKSLEELVKDFQRRKKSKSATASMKYSASRIAAKLHRAKPDFSNYLETAEFIAFYTSEYERKVRAEKAEEEESIRKEEELLLLYRVKAKEEAEARKSPVCKWCGKKFEAYKGNAYCPDCRVPEAALGRIQKCSVELHDFLNEVTRVVRKQEPYSKLTGEELNLVLVDYAVKNVTTIKGKEVLKRIVSSKE